MLDIQSPTVRGLRIGEEKRRKKEERKKKETTGQNIMTCPIPYGGHKKEDTTGQKYNVRICYAGRP